MKGKEVLTYYKASGLWYAHLPQMADYAVGMGKTRKQAMRDFYHRDNVKRKDLYKGINATKSKWEKTLSRSRMLKEF